MFLLSRLRCVNLLHFSRISVRMNFPAFSCPPHSNSSLITKVNNLSFIILWSFFLSFHIIFFKILFVIMFWPISVSAGCHRGRPKKEKQRCKFNARYAATGPNRTRRGLNLAPVKTCLASKLSPYPEDPNWFWRLPSSSMAMVESKLQAVLTEGDTWLKIPWLFWTQSTLSYVVTQWRHFLNHRKCHFTREWCDGNVMKKTTRNAGQTKFFPLQTLHCYNVDLVTPLLFQFSFPVVIVFL